MTSLLALVVLAAPMAFIAAAVVAQMNPGSRPRVAELAIRRAADLGLIAAAAGAVLTVQHGLLLSPTLGWKGLGLSIRLDPLSIVMLCMVSLLAALIVRYSLNYLAGDDRQGVFLGRLAVTIAAVEVLVVSGNLVLLVGAWIATSLFLYRLLLFYDERPGAQVAGRKKFIATRVGDACLIAAAVLLYAQFGTGDLEQIFTALEGADPARWSLGATGMAALGIAAAGALMAAQFPTHGWLVEVMETPTPVSALLHAGILNAGPFLVVRFAFVVDGSTLAQSFLIVVGGFTALFASTTLLTQTAIKKALGYSSAAHMGFMLMICGFGVYPAAMLHLVAHSFYKAHAFLSSGSVVDEARAEKVALPRRHGHPLRILGSIAIAVAFYVGYAQLWGINPLHEPALLAIGALLVMALAQIIAPALDSDGPLVGTARACGLAFLVATAFFSLEAGAAAILHTQFPAVIAPAPTRLALIALIPLVFGTAVFLQMLGPALADRAWRRRFAIHLRNGFYANAWFERLVGALRTGAPRQPSSTARRVPSSR